MTDAAVLRNDLAGQLRHTVEELEATKQVAARLTDAELESRLMGPSVKECYGTMADWDRTVILPLLRRMQEECEPEGVAALPEIHRWNAVALGDILEAAQGARRALIAYVRALPDTNWTRRGTLAGETHDVFGLLHALTQHDVHLLQSVARQLQRSF